MNVGVDLIEVDDGLLPAQMLKKKIKPIKHMGGSWRGEKLNPMVTARQHEGEIELGKKEQGGGGTHSRVAISLMILSASSQKRVTTSETKPGVPPSSCSICSCWNCSSTKP